MSWSINNLKRLAADRAYRRSMSYRLPAASRNQGRGVSHYLCTATIVRNEARFIREFVAFHKIVGVDHMLIYDDCSEDDLRKEIEDFILAGFVELLPWPRFLHGKNHQFAAYQHAVAHVMNATHWLAMIDADEFLFAPSSGDLKSELVKREGFAALSIYSRTFGTGRLQSLVPGDFVIERLTRRAALDHVKNRTQRTIVRPEAVAAIRSANTCVLHGTDKLGWDENGKPVLKTGETGHTSNDLRINHYFTRAEEDFRAKLARQYFGKQTLYDEKMTAKSLEAADGSLSVEDDVTLHAYLPRLREAAGAGGLRKVPATSRSGNTERKALDL
jgi:Glycosyltransferase family 92